MTNAVNFDYSDSVYLVKNGRVKCIVVADCEQDAIDNIVNDNLWDSLLMSEADHKEYDRKGWHDSFLYAGHFSKPFWCEGLHIERIHRER